MSEQCACTIETGCGEYDEAGCDYCRDLDIYLPCPVFGNLCGPPGGECDCCTPEQQSITVQYYAAAFERAKQRREAAE